MARMGRIPIPWWVLMITNLPTGCAALHQGPAPLPALPTLAAEAPPPCSPKQPASSLRQVLFEMPTQGPSSTWAPNPEPLPFAGMSELAVDAVIEQVVARNPSLAQMTAAWQAASARYPQVTSLDDPMFGATVAPASIGSDNVEFGYRLEVSQKLPFPGKLGLRGQSAQAEAAAASNEVDDMRLQLIESAKSSFYEYYLVTR